MKLPRRKFLYLAKGVAALPAVSRFAWAQTYPTRPVCIVVGFAPGGATDIMARLVGQWLSERLGQPFVIENRLGAAGNVAAEAVVPMIHVPYRGGAPAVTDLLSGQVQVVFGTITTSSEHIRAGKLRALAVTTATRSDMLPEVPTMAEFVPGYEASNWNGICVPKNTSAEIIDRVNQAINAGLAEPKIKARLAELGGVILPGSPADFGKLIAEDTEKWAKVIKFAGIKPE